MICQSGHLLCRGHYIRDYSTDETSLLCTECGAPALLAETVKADFFEARAEQPGGTPW